MKKINLENYIYIFAIVFSLYFSYLIYNAYNIGIQANLMLTLVILAISTSLLYLFNKNIKTNNIEKKVLKIIAIIAVIISIVVLIFNLDFFAKKFTDSQIKIVAQNQKNEYSNGNTITIKNIIIDNMPIDLSSINLNDNWKYENYKIISTNQTNGELILNFTKHNNINIVFAKTEEAGTVKIIDGETEENVDLYSYQTDTYNYEVKSNSYIDILFAIRLICSYIMILGIVYLLGISIYYMYKTKKSIILITLVFIAMIRFFYYVNLRQYTIYPDSSSYINYNFWQLLNLQIPGRTPVYPLIIRMCQIIFGEISYLNFVVLFQIITAFIAVIFFYKTLKLIIKNEKIVSLITIFYGGTFAICGWEQCILTESFALSGYVFFIYNIIKYIKEAKLINGISAVVISLILTFLKPSAIIFAIILCAFWILRFIIDRREIKKDIKCCIASLVAITIVVIYSIIFYNTHQIYSISDATIRQNLFVCIDQGFYKASNNPQFIKDIEELKEKVKDYSNLSEINKVWVVEKEIQRKYGNEIVQEQTAYCQKQMLEEYTKYIGNLIKGQSTKYYDGYSLYLNNDLGLINIVEEIFKKVNYIYIYIMIIGELCVGVYLWIKNKQIPWIHMGIFAFSISIVLSTFIATNDEYMRTSIGVLPFFYMSAALLLDYIISKLELNGNKKMST